MQQKFANTDNNSSRYKTISNLQGTQNNQERNKKIHKEEKDEEASPPKAKERKKNKQHWTSCWILQQKQARVCD
jgi:hypothetical protein